MIGGANGNSGHVAADLMKSVEATAPALGVVTQPTISIHMSGFLRVQVPCKLETQRLYDLETPEVKVNPALSIPIAAESREAGDFATAVLRDTLRNSPQLKSMAKEIKPSYAVVDGKLFYVFLLPVRSA